MSNLLHYMSNIYSKSQTLQIKFCTVSIECVSYNFILSNQIWFVRTRWVSRVPFSAALVAKVKSSGELSHALCFQGIFIVAGSQGRPAIQLEDDSAKGSHGNGTGDHESGGGTRGGAR